LMRKLSHAMVTGWWLKKLFMLVISRPTVAGVVVTRPVWRGIQPPADVS
jgi:hypothetical protein